MQFVNTKRHVLKVSRVKLWSGQLVLGFESGLASPANFDSTFQPKHASYNYPFKVYFICRNFPKWKISRT